ncbi:hypothetical protein R3P38DRAFT_3485159 [Favolaschia claudopus]|uniref:Uncharacterized protein n=1 Tax=Favolaschia claudopus TaxID=2862362 RepID=A0AAW0CBM1_9AGAR
MLQASEPNSPALLSLNRDLRTERLIYAGTLSVCIWDILHSLREDYTIVALNRNNFRSHTAAYVVSRISTLTYVLGFTLFNTYPLNNCNTTHIVFGVFFIVSCGATSLLFFHRVRGVWRNRPLITYIFGFLWLCVLGSATLVPIGIDTTKVPYACAAYKVHSYVSTPGVVISVYDTAVFLAISYRLLWDSFGFSTLDRDSDFKKIALLIFRGTGMHNLSLSLFKDGQKYYMITILLSAAAFVMVLIPGIPAHFRNILALPNMALNNIMAARVYRNAKLRYARSWQPSLPLLNTPEIEHPLTTDLAARNRNI